MSLISGGLVGDMAHLLNSVDDMKNQLSALITSSGNDSNRITMLEVRTNEDLLKYEKRLLKLEVPMKNTTQGNTEPREVIKALFKNVLTPGTTIRTQWNGRCVYYDNGNYIYEGDQKGLIELLLVKIAGPIGPCVK